jgi:hypothetical protein
MTKAGWLKRLRAAQQAEVAAKPRPTGRGHVAQAKVAELERECALIETELLDAMKQEAMACQALRQAIGDEVGS